MLKWITCAALAMTALLTACNDGGNVNTVTTIDSDFETTADGWNFGFSDYSTKTDSSSLELSALRDNLPKGLDTTRSALILQSSNRSDDVFMFLTKKVSGFVPGQTYNLSFNITIATNYPANSIGAGGSPGSSVFLKAGASPNEPTVKLIGDVYTFSLDKGVQSQAGKDALVLGNLANGEESPVYRVVERNSAGQSFSVKANAAGEIWFFVGSDSGYEGKTILIFDRISITATEVLPD